MEDFHAYTGPTHQRIDKLKKLVEVGGGLQTRILAARTLLHSGSRMMSPGPLNQVTAEVRGHGREQLLKDSPDSAHLERAKATFKAKWGLSKLFPSPNVLLPTDSSTLKLLYGKECVPPLTP